MSAPSDQHDQHDQHEDTVEVLRSVWTAEGTATDALDEACGNTKSCRNMAGVTFEGFAESTGTDLKTAWRETLAREGKLSTSGGTIRDLVLGSTEAH